MTDSDAFAGLDQIHIDELTFDCIIGVNEEERHRKQKIVVDVTMQVDLGDACRSDCLDDSVDYKAVKLRILDMARASQFALIETLAQRIAELALEDEKVRSVTVTVAKPEALRFAKTVWVRITRGRESTDGRR